MAGDVELLYAIKDLILDQKLTSKVELGYNAADDLIQIKKTVDGIEHLRVITDPDIADNVVDKWIEYGEWSVV